jgi:hypothetical protein
MRWNAAPPCVPPVGATAQSEATSTTTPSPPARQTDTCPHAHIHTQDIPPPACTHPQVPQGQDPYNAQHDAEHRGHHPGGGRPVPARQERGAEEDGGDGHQDVGQGHALCVCVFMGWRGSVCEVWKETGRWGFGVD